MNPPNSASATGLSTVPRIPVRKHARSLRVRPLAIAAVIASGHLVSCGRNSPDARLEAQERQHLEAMAQDITSAIRATEEQTSRLASEIAGMYPDLQRNAANADRSQYKLEPNGVLHRPAAIKNEQAAVFVSGAVKVDESVMTVVLGTEALDPVLKRIPEVHPAVVQAYYNDCHSYNRIYPPFDVLTQYPPGMPIPTYNFYYLADSKHNPERKAVWVKEPYVDPAGRGWMISCIAPVYHENSLMGVAGLDITVEAIVRNFDFENANKMCLLAAADGTVVATGEHLIHVLRLPALKNHRYVDTVRSDTFRSADYNMLKSRSIAIRNMADALLVKNNPSAMLELDDVKWTINSTPIPALDWRLLEFIPRQ